MCARTRPVERNRRPNTEPAPYGPMTSLLPMYTTNASGSMAAQSRAMGRRAWELTAVMAALITSMRAPGKRSSSMALRMRTKPYWSDGVPYAAELPSTNTRKAFVPL